MADSGYDAEVKSIQAFLSMQVRLTLNQTLSSRLCIRIFILTNRINLIKFSFQHPASQPVINPNSLDINLEEYVAPKFLRKMKSRVSKNDRHLLFYTLIKKIDLEHLLIAYLFKKQIKSQLI